MTGIGARAVGEKDYRGEAYLAGSGQADVISWTPNAVTVNWRGANPGDTLVLNQNWDPGWRGGGEASYAWHDAVGVTVHEKDGELTFRYVPRFFYVGWLFCIAAIAILVGLRKVPILSKA